MTNKKQPFLDSFQGHVYRYIDQSGQGRPAVSSLTPKPELNDAKYEAYFTVNGFEGKRDAKKDQCTNINSFFIDIDGRKDLKELEDIKEKLDPTFIIETRNGYHIYWVLDETIYKEDNEDWESDLRQWEQIEQSIVTELDGDKVVKDVTRVLRIPGSKHWKQAKTAFKIKGLYKKPAHTYSMDHVQKIFPIKEDKQDKSTTKYADAEKKDFFNRVNEKYPIEERGSFLALMSGKEGTLPVDIGSRNEALLITSSLARQAGWSSKKMNDHIKKIGWHGIEKETGGAMELRKTIESAYQGGYTYSYKNYVIAHNMDHTEQQKIALAYTNVGKEKKEVDKTRFSNYEYELHARHPNLKKNESGVIFDYAEGVYNMMSEQEISNLILNNLYDDMLWGYRTKRNVSDKVACLIAIIPDFEITRDKGDILNVKNGLLNMKTRELNPHTPKYVSLIQSPVEYDVNAVSHIWDRCIEQWMDGPESKEKIQLLQQYCGYVLSPSTKYSCALFLIGDGGNGKSTFADTVAMVLGKKATSNIDLDDLYSDFGFAGLIGKRLNIVEEISGNYYESHKLKKLISGEEVTIKVKYKSQFTFRPEAKFIFAVNTMPRVDDTSTATERRIATVEFRNNFRINTNVDLRYDGGLLAQELPGILNWMLKGNDDLSREGKFTKTVEQVVLLNEYRQENSSIEGFIAECIEFNEGRQVSARDLYDKYKVYCAKDGRKAKSNIAFTKELRLYAKRQGSMSFVARTNGKEENRFEGIEFNDIWSDVDTIYDKVGGVKKWNDF